MLQFYNIFDENLNVKIKGKLVKATYCEFVCLKIVAWVKLAQSIGKVAL